MVFSKRIPWTGLPGHSHRLSDLIDFNPTGTIVFYPFDDIPIGYLRMDGQTVNHDDYPVLGEKFGSAPGGTFVIPDYQDIPIFGASITNTAGTITGSDNIDLSHTHTITHTHQIDPPNTTSSGPSATSAAATPLLGSAPTTTHTHDVNISAFTSGASSNADTGIGLSIVDKRPRRVYAWVLIKAS